MVCRSCASKATTSQPGIAAKLGIDFTGVKGKNASRRDAFVEWVVAANGLWRETLPGAVVEMSESRKADIFNRTDKERNICGQSVILKDGRCFSFFFFLSDAARLLQLQNWRMEMKMLRSSGDEGAGLPKSITVNRKD